VEINLIFGLSNAERDKIINQFNFLLLLARYHMYANNQAVKHKLHLYKYLTDVKTQLEIMQNVALEQNKVKKLEDTWSELLNNM
jgi:hypothetical protein